MNRVKTYLQQELNRERLISLVSLIMALFVAGESFFPFRQLLFPLLIPTILITILFFAFSLKRVRAKLRGTLGIYLPFTLAMLLFLIALQKSNLAIELFYYELFNMGVILLIVLLQILLISTKEQLLRHRNQFFRTLFYLMTAVAILALARFGLFLWGIELPEILMPDRLLHGTALTHNPDIFILAPIATMIGLILFKFRQKAHIVLSILYHFSFLLMFYTIIWSGSSKGFLLMIILVFVLIFLRIFFLFHSSRVRNFNLIKNLNVMILVIGFSAIMGHYLLNVVSGETKERWIAGLRLDSYHFKSEVTLITFAHIRLFDHRADLQGWYDRLWGKEPADEEAVRHRIAFALTEKENVLLAPEPISFHDQTVTYRIEQISRIMDQFRGYSTHEKIFGKGLGYLGQPGVFVLGRQGEMPVNINNNYMANALLASGLLGLGVLVWLHLQVLVLFWKNRKRLLALFSLFLTTAVLYLLIPNTLFACPLLLVAIAIPFRYRTAKE